MNERMSYNPAARYTERYHPERSSTVPRCGSSSRISAGRLHPRRNYRRGDNRVIDSLYSERPERHAEVNGAGRHTITALKAGKKAAR